VLGLELRQLVAGGLPLVRGANGVLGHRLLLAGDRTSRP
jgi:hypothetical protein